MKMQTPEPETSPLSSPIKPMQDLEVVFSQERLGRNDLADKKFMLKSLSLKIRDLNFPH
jgi:hypothetical protein